MMNDTMRKQMVDAKALKQFIPTAKKALDDLDAVEVVARCLAGEYITRYMFSMLIHGRKYLCTTIQKLVVTRKALSPGLF